MNKNTLLYNACVALLNTARMVKPIDPEYAQQLLDKAELFKSQIIIDDEVEKEVKEFEKRIGIEIEKEGDKC